MAVSVAWMWKYSRTWDTHSFTLSRPVRRLDIRFKRRFVGCGDAGEVFDLLGPGFGVEPLGIAFLANLQWRINKHLDKASLRHNLPGQVAVGPVRRDERGDANDASIGKQSGHVPYAANVLCAIFG